MITVTLSCVVEAKVLPINVIAGDLRYTVTHPDGTSDTQSTPNLSAVFTVTNPGAYTASVERLDNAGNVIGSPVTEQFTVSSYDAPASITVTLS